MDYSGEVGHSYWICAAAQGTEAASFSRLGFGGGGKRYSGRPGDLLLALGGAVMRKKNRLLTEPVIVIKSDAYSDACTGLFLC